MNSLKVKQRPVILGSVFLANFLSSIAFQRASRRLILVTTVKTHSGVSMLKNAHPFDMSYFGPLFLTLGPSQWPLYGFLA
jgi:hypothetical protein